MIAVIAPIDSNDTGLKLVDNSRSALPDKGIDKLANPWKSAISKVTTIKNGKQSTCTIERKWKKKKTSSGIQIRHVDVEG